MFIGDLSWTAGSAYARKVATSSSSAPAHVNKLLFRASRTMSLLSGLIGGLHKLLVGSISAASTHQLQQTKGYQ